MLERCWTYWPQGTAIALCAGGCHPGRVQEGSKAIYKRYAIRITQSSDSGIYLTQDRCSKMENFPENSLLLLHRAPPPPPSLCQGPVVESCDPDIVVTLEHWHNYTLLHPQPAPVAVAHHNKSNPSTTADTRLDFFINNILTVHTAAQQYNWRSADKLLVIDASQSWLNLNWQLFPHFNQMPISVKN